MSVTDGGGSRNAAQVVPRFQWVLIARHPVNQCLTLTAPQTRQQLRKVKFLSLARHNA